MAYPDFVCMGFQKCGTTTLFDLLKQHPDIVLCRDVKEPMFYRVPFMHILGRKYYRKRYFGHVPAGDGRLKGEINAGLTFNNCAKKLGRDMEPGTKMIFMIRDPVSRSYSAYKYFLARGFLPVGTIKDDIENGHAVSFDCYVRSVLERPGKRRRVMKSRLKYLVLSQSNYADCIEEYLNKFDLENMEFVVFEEFIKDQHKSCREVYAFLDVGDVTEIDYDMRLNEGKEKPLSPFWTRLFMVVRGMNHFFYDLCAMTHWAPGLYGRFYSGCYEKVRTKAMTEDTDRSGMMPETREYLQSYFEDDVKRTEKITGRSLRKLWGWV